MRCRKSSATYLVLILASLCLYVSCGIPTFINLDRHILLSGVSDTDANSVSITIGISDPQDIIDQYPTGSPSLKLFYVLSTSASIGATSYVTGQNSDLQYFPLTLVNTHFSSLYGMKSGNGSLWTPQTNRAPGFYLYRNASGSVRSSKTAPRETDLFEDPGGILVGTFAQSDSEDGAYVFGRNPQMDIEIPLHAGDITLIVTLESSGYLKVGDDLYLADYQKSPFPSADDDLRERFDDIEDAYWYHNLARDVHDALYLHIYGAVFGGEGNFTNIYWSSLKHLGTISL